MKKSKHVESVYYTGRKERKREVNYLFPYFISAGEVYSDFTEKKYLVMQTKAEMGLLKKHDWSLELYNIKETYTFEWYK